MATNMFQFIAKRGISTSAQLCGKKNFRKFYIYNKRGPRLFKEIKRLNPEAYPDMPIEKRGLRDVGINVRGQYVEVPEKIPQLILPDLTDCEFKPYVSYKAPDVVQTEFTSEDLFNAIYARKILDDYKDHKLNEDGTPKEPSAEETLTPDVAHGLARKTGSDIF
jgi:large subunit ribosomal protein L41